MHVAYTDRPQRCSGEEPRGGSGLRQSRETVVGGPVSRLPKSTSSRVTNWMDEFAKKERDELWRWGRIGRQGRSGGARE